MLKLVQDSHGRIDSDPMSIHEKPLQVVRSGLGKTDILTEVNKEVLKKKGQSRLAKLGCRALVEANDTSGAEVWCAETEK